MAQQKRKIGTVADTIRVYYRAGLRHKKFMILALLTPVGGIFMSILVPFFASRILAGIMQDSSSLDMYLALFAGCASLGLLANRFGFRNNMKFQARVLSDLNHMVFDRLLHRGLSYHANQIGGKLVSDTLDFVASFGQLASITIINGLTFLLVILIGVAVVFVNSWQLGLFVATAVAIVMTWTWINSQTRSQLRAKRLVATKNLTAHLSDSIVNAQTVKTFAQEKLELQRNLELNERLKNLRINDWQRAGKSGNNRMAALVAMQFGLMLIIVQLTRSDPSVLATGIFAFTYTFMLTNRLFEIDNMTRQLEEAFLNASPMTKMLLEEIEIEDAAGAKQLEVSKGAIELRKVSFAYPDNSQNGAVFDDFSLSVKPGEKIGLVGPSGGGKSTLTRLMLRFESVDAGEILIDGQDISQVTQESLRQAVAYVPQEPLLFHRTIRENIAYGRQDATDEAVVRAAKQANAHEFIGSLPHGYDTMVGERGVKLSGGQRQRVAIARAILKDAPILILDEATSALDSENEVQVQEALWHLMQGRTALVIAHRLSTIQRMDRIIVLADGAIAEEGSHRTLLRHKGLYAKLWKHQSGGFIEE